MTLKELRFEMKDNFSVGAPSRTVVEKLILRNIKDCHTRLEAILARVYDGRAKYAADTMLEWHWKAKSRVNDTNCVVATEELYQELLNKTRGAFSNKQLRECYVVANHTYWTIFSYYREYKGLVSLYKELKQ